MVAPQSNPHIHPDPAARAARAGRSPPRPAVHSPWPGNELAPFKERMANATSVKVMTSLLGVKLGDTLKQSRARLDKRSDPAHPRKEARDAGEGEGKIIWPVAGTDY